jgi:hypothetical protein
MYRLKVYVHESINLLALLICSYSLQLFVSIHLPIFPFLVLPLPLPLNSLQPPNTLLPAPGGIH